MDIPLVTAAIDLSKTFITRICDVIDACVEDVDLAKKLKSEIALKINDQEYNIKMKVLSNEMEINSPFYRNWRPLICYIVAADLAFYALVNHIIIPLCEMFKFVAPQQIVLDNNFLILAGALTGVYSISRTFEKVSANKKDK